MVYVAIRGGEGNEGERKVERERATGESGEEMH